MTTSLVGHFDLVSKKLGKNCGFFNNSIFMGQVSISGVHTVYVKRLCIQMVLDQKNDFLNNFVR